MNEYDPHQPPPPPPPSWEGGPTSSDGEGAPTEYWRTGQTAAPHTGEHAAGPPVPEPGPDRAHASSGWAPTERPGPEYAAGSWPPGPQPRGRGQGLAVAALVLGIVSLVLFVVSVLPILLAIAAIVCALLHLRPPHRPGRSMAVGGLVTSLIGLALGILTTILWGMVGLAFAPVVSEMWDCTRLADQTQVDQCIDGVLEEPGYGPGDLSTDSPQDQAV